MRTLRDLRRSLAVGARHFTCDLTFHHNGGTSSTMKRPSTQFLLGALVGCLPARGAAPTPADANWYSRSFFLLHLDHHTTDQAAVGRDADPAETARLINLVKPDVIQIHAKGNPGWTTYPSDVGHSPPQLARDVMQVWTDIARRHGYTFSAYYNLGRDREIMQRKPEWNRVRAGGKPYDNMLCYHSGVAEQYLWPMIDEIMTRYRPGGFWFDGSCFTVMNCYCARCGERFQRDHRLQPPRNAQEPGWAEFKEMQRQIYREFCAETAARIKRRDPACLVAINWAYALRMPEAPPPGVDYFTGDHGNSVDDLAPDAIWYDSQGLPFDLMTTVFYSDAEGAKLKPRPQLEQELAIIVAHGGRYFAWDNPTAESGLKPERFEMMTRVVTPYLRARQPWCLGSRARPDIALFHGAAAHYAQSNASAAAFPRQNPALLAACEGLRRLHLSPEMISDQRLAQGDVLGRLLLLEDTAALTDSNRRALRAYVEKGGRVLLTGRAVDAAQMPGSDAPSLAGVVRRILGQGEIFALPHPLFAAGASEPPPSSRDILQELLPSAGRWLTTDAPETVETLLREKSGARILHALNIAPGQRHQDPKSKSFLRTQVTELPAAPTFSVSVRLAGPPASVTLQPQGTPVSGATWREGRLHLTVPSFATHQMVVIAGPGQSP